MLSLLHCRTSNCQSSVYADFGKGSIRQTNRHFKLSCKAKLLRHFRRCSLSFADAFVDDAGSDSCEGIMLAS